MIKSHVDQLATSLSGPRSRVSMRPFKELHRTKNYTGMVNLARAAFGLRMPMRVGFVNRGGPSDAPAWVETPVPMPLFGTEAFRKLRVTIYLRRDFVERSNVYVLTAAIAHELSHVVLNSLMHPLKGEEEAVDITAMLSGFDDFYVAAAETWDNRSYGYISKPEIRHARHLINCKRERIPILRWARMHRSTIATLGVLLLMGILWFLAHTSTTRTEVRPVYGSSAGNFTFCEAEATQLNNERIQLNAYNSYSIEQFNDRVRAYNIRCTGNNTVP